MIERILQKSEAYRRKVARLLTFIIGIAIFSAWLVIAGFNVRISSTPRVDPEDEAQTAQQFRSNLPNLSQEQEVTTELSRQNAAKATEAMPQEEEKKSIIDRFFRKE